MQDKHAHSWNYNFTTPRIMQRIFKGSLPWPRRKTIWASRQSRSYRMNSRNWERMKTIQAIWVQVPSNRQLFKNLNSRFNHFSHKMKHLRLVIKKQSMLSILNLRIRSSNWRESKSHWKLNSTKRNLKPRSSRTTSTRWLSQSKRARVTRRL